MSSVHSTHRALLAPRRAIPMALVIAAVLTAEAVAARRPVAVLVDLGLCAAFVLVAPAAWRQLCVGLEPKRSLLLGYASYLALCALLVALLGGLIPRVLGIPATYLTDGPSLALVLVMFVVGGWGLGRDVDLEAGLKAEQARTAQLAQEAGHAQLLALRAQLDPHFLFNTLNAIAEWCREDPRVAEAATLRLAEVLRSILAGVKQSRWPLERELGLLRDLFELYEIRDAERYQLQLELPGELPQAELPPLLLLPLFENAITHGPSAGHDGVVRLTVEVESPRSGRLLITLENPGEFTGRRPGGEGIAMVERRLALAYEGSARLEIKADGDHTLTTLSVPPQPLASELES